MQQISSGVSLCHAVGQSARRGAGRAAELARRRRCRSTRPTRAARSPRCKQEDATLGSVNTVLQTIHTLVLRAGDGSLNDGDRGSIATQLQSLRSQLMTLANATDRAGQLPVRRLSEQRAAVHHERGRRRDLFAATPARPRVQITDSHMVQTGDNGIAIFGSVAPIGTSSVPAATTGNTGTGVISTVSLTNPTDPTNADTYHDQLHVGDHLHRESDRSGYRRGDHERAASRSRPARRSRSAASRCDDHRRAERRRQLHGDAGHARQHGRVRQSEPVDHHAANAGVGRRLDGQLARTR